MGENNFKFSIEKAKKHKDFLICIDSDGCAFDTMNAKHKLCFAPLLIDDFYLQDHYDELFNFWQSVNLYSNRRGVNRFKGVAIFIEYALEKKYLQFSNTEKDMFDAYLSWTKNTKALSNATLENFINENTQNEFAKKILTWSVNVNKKIASLTHDEKKVFNNVFDCVKLMKEKADVAVVSSANKTEIFSEWEHANLLNFVGTICTQEDGSKKASTQKLIALGYDVKKVLFLGDALSDLETAETANCLFYPIVPDNETSCWKLLQDKYLKLFLEGNYNRKIENELKEKLKKKLP